MAKVKVKISKMTGKLEGIVGINTNPLSNSFCKKMQKGETICKHCYSCAMLRGLRKNCMPVWERNSQILSSRLLETSEIPRITAAFCRFHAHGELINKIHFENFIRIAEANPWTKFSFFTKRTNLCDLTNLPDNVTMVYSNPTLDRVVTKVPKGFHKVFNVITKKEDARVNCGARSCITCQKCFKREGCSVLVEKVKKRGKQA